MTVINFYLTRHGETQWNKIGKFQGQLDSPLTDKGYRQADGIAKQLINHNIDLIVSSTLPRAKSTAEICQVTVDCPLNFAPALIERDFGLWQGKAIDEVKSEKNFHAIFQQVNASAPPKGESGLDCAVRFQQALIDIANANAGNSCHQITLPDKAPAKLNDTAIKNILVVSHGDILRCFLALFVEGFSDKQAINSQQKAFDNGCIFQVSYQSKPEKFILTAALDITQPATVIVT
ncbi:histidine phosphatase family protein [Colwellia hornerae]|uniref:Histidine phosphatase family protein n=1 Tax=Colwellia hornerae TaxID=89402 RepID=A0A5C6Q4P4_9GAMM|nr:histidine phosphatase family protein [Colwellia hornerae]TWX48082.1 histidine phosphatase family protein [Colwellia hornerae]TWX54901.1 histidine phosphatase family protein [Colwellia hornerae]TWX63759.1 histidine phosphatase family protein [Colwellia hornerae]